MQTELSLPLDLVTSKNYYVFNIQHFPGTFLTVHQFKLTMGFTTSVQKNLNKQLLYFSISCSCTPLPILPNCSTHTYPSCSLVTKPTVGDIADMFLRCQNNRKETSQKNTNLPVFYCDLPVLTAASWNCQWRHYVAR